MSKQNPQRDPIVQILRAAYKRGMIVLKEREKAARQAQTPKSEPKEHKPQT